MIGWTMLWVRLAGGDLFWDRSYLDDHDFSVMNLGHEEIIRDIYVGADYVCGINSQYTTRFRQIGPQC